MFLSFLELDQNLSAAAANLLPHNALFDLIFRFLSLQGLTIAIWIILLGMYFVWEEKRHHEFILYFVSGFGITTFIVNIVLKNIFLRERPWVLSQILENYCPSDFSFPSGHAAGAFAGAVIFAHFDKKRKYLYYGMAVLISYSRVYLHCHYLLDVIFGALIGYLISWIVIRYLTGRRKV